MILVQFLWTILWKNKFQNPRTARIFRPTPKIQIQKVPTDLSVYLVKVPRKKNYAKSPVMNLIINIPQILQYYFLRLQLSWNLEFLDFYPNTQSTPQQLRIHQQSTNHTPMSIMIAVTDLFPIFLSLVGVPPSTLLPQEGSVRRHTLRNLVRVHTRGIFCFFWPI